MSGLPTDLSISGTTVRLRRAAEADLPEILRLLVDDQLGASRDSADPADLAPYRRAFNAIDADPNQLLVVAVDGESVVGTMQVTLIPGLARRGALRAQIEAVRVAAPHRGRGLGAAMMGWAVDEARDRGCALVQLTSDKSRGDAHRFYDRLGFTASHEGYKLAL